MRSLATTLLMGYDERWETARAGQHRRPTLVRKVLSETDGGARPAAHDRCDRRLWLRLKQRRARTRKPSPSRTRCEPPRIAVADRLRSRERKSAFLLRRAWWRATFALVPRRRDRLQRNPCRRSLSAGGLCALGAQREDPSIWSVMGPPVRRACADSLSTITPIAQFHFEGQGGTLVVASEREDGARSIALDSQAGASSTSATRNCPRPMSSIATAPSPARSR